MTAPTAAAEAELTSLDGLKAANAELLERVPEEGPKGDEDVKRVRAFLRRAAKLGTVLDVTADRKFAQGVLEYWAATLYGGARGREGEASTRLSPDETVLAPFAGAAVQRAAAAGEEAVRALASRDGRAEEATRGLLLRLVRFADDGASFVPAAVPRAELEAGGDGLDREALEALKKAAVVAEGPDGKVRLCQEALARHWPRYAGWLQKRALFRDAALFWEKHDRAQGALFTGTLLEEAEAYRDFNDLEDEFVRRCQAEAERQREDHKRKVWVWRGVAAVLLTLCLVIGFLAYRWWAEWGVSAARGEALRASARAENASTLTLNLALMEEGKDDTTSLAHVIKKLLIVKALAPVVYPNANEGDDRQAALENWKKLKAQLAADNDWFKTFFEQLEEGKNIAVIEDPNSSQADRQKALDGLADYLGLFFRSYFERKSSKRLEQMRSAWVTQMSEAAKRLSAAAVSGKPLSHVDIYRDRFRKLAHGEVALSAKDDAAPLNDAVRAFNDVLDKWKDGKAPAAVRREMPPALEKLLNAAGER